MQYTAAYQSSVGDVLLAADETGLTGLWFEGEKFYALSLDPEHEERETPIFAITRRWLDIYFSGHEPDFMPPVHMIGSEFRRCVWELLLQIPYGTTVTYGDLARQVARRRGLRRMSAQAVGGAVGHNEISIIVPCHRVVGTNGSLTGYAGGMDKKRRLLELEGVDMEKFFVPARGTALYRGFQHAARRLDIRDTFRCWRNTGWARRHIWPDRAADRQGQEFQAGGKSPWHG